MRDFVARYGALAPRSPIEERLAFRRRLLAQHRCREETLHHEFPER